MNTNPRIVAYCDGSALRNPGPGGFSWWVNDNSWFAHGNPGPVTNNAMELSAIHHLLANTPAELPLLIYSDSQYSINAITQWAHSWQRRGWKKPDGAAISNINLIRDIYHQVSKRDTRFAWVKGHSGNIGNTIVDQRARAAAEQAKRTTNTITIGPGWPHTHPK